MTASDEEITYTDTEQEIIILRAVWDLIDGMVNYQIFEKDHGKVGAELKFKTPSAARLFNILLADFLSKPKKYRSKKEPFNLPKAPKEPTDIDRTFLFYLRHLCDNPILNKESGRIQKPMERFIDWLEGECFVEKVWFGSIDIEMDIRVKRLLLLKICGNIAKHSFAGLGWCVERIKEVLEENGKEIDSGQGFLILPEFYEWFHDDILNYHATMIAEHLNNIRWGIFDYLQPEPSQSFEKADPHPINYRFNYPDDCLHPLAKAMYWDLMNQVRTPPYFPIFTTSKWLRKRY